MKNREKLLKKSEYDLLVELNNSIKYIEPVCIIDALTGNITEECDIISCEECIQAWLNQER